MKLSTLKGNAEAANKGGWVKDIPGMGDIELQTRGTNTSDYRRRMQAMIRALPPSKKPKGIVDPVEMDRITGTCLLDCALTGWKNVLDNDGNQIPYTKEQASTFLLDPEYSAFRDGAYLAAMFADEGAAEADEATEKN